MRGSSWIAIAAAAVVALALLLAAALRPFGGAAPAGQQVLAIAADLRCPVCPGESAAAADTPEARAMRDQIAADLAAGMTRRQILDQFVAQYGTWILYRPPARGAYLLLWLAPVLAAAGIGAGLWRLLPRRARAGEPPPDGSAPAAPVSRDLARRLGRLL